MTSFPVKKVISFEDFEKLDIRVGTIASVSDVENSKKLVNTTATYRLDFQDDIWYHGINWDA